MSGGVKALFTPGGAAAPEPPPKATTVLDLVTRVALPVTLAIIGSLQTQRDRFWALLGLAAVAFLAGLWKPATSAITRRRHRRHDEGVARRAIPHLGRLVRRFGELVSSGQVNTLEYILQQQIGTRDATAVAKLRLPPERLVDGWYYYLSVRLSAAPPTLATLQQAISEFITLLTDYLIYHVQPVFEQMPPEIRAALSPTARSELQRFRERVARLCDDCEAFLRETEESLTTVRLPARHLAVPKPLE